MTGLILVGSCLIICMVMTTPEQVRQARARLSRRIRWFWPLPVILWAILLYPWPT